MKKKLIIINILALFLFFISCSQIKSNKVPKTKQKNINTSIQEKEIVVDYGINPNPKIKDYYVLDSLNSQIITEKCFVLIYPTDEKIEKLKELNETDFYALADDNNYWMSELIEISKKMKINTIKAKKRKLCFISKNQIYTVDLDKKDSGELFDWNLIIFNDSKTPEFSKFVEPNEVYLNKYFDLNE